MCQDKSKRERWGLDKYSGRENWPGCGGRPPLEIVGNSFVLYWFTDGRCVFKVFLLP